ncbi:MAG: DUF4276 family protein [Rhodospirillaceae bacterium]
MHFEFLVEGHSDLIALSILMDKILGTYGQTHTWKIHKHRGIGTLPAKPCAKPDKKDQTLLHNLPSKLRAYGAERRDDVAVVVLVDLDSRPDCVSFKRELEELLNYCTDKPKTLFRIAIEEMEAWFFGDKNAIIKAYPNADLIVLNGYVQDSRCGTWEKLADAIHPGGSVGLKNNGRRSVRTLEQKQAWAKDICPHIDINNNQSPSFCTFRDGVLNMVAAWERARSS